MVFVEVIGSYVCYGLDVAVLHHQGVFVELVGLIKVLQLVVDATSGDLQLWLKGMEGLGLLNDSDSQADVILFLVDFAKVKKGFDVVIMLNRGKQLFLRLFQEVQMVVALPQGQLPPRIFVIVEFGCITSQLQAFL